MKTAASKNDRNKLRREEKQLQELARGGGLELELHKDSPMNAIRDINTTYLGGMTVGGMSFFGAIGVLVYEPWTLAFGAMGGVVGLAYGLWLETR